MLLNKVSVRYYRGKNNSVQDILPVMLFFHGGGWVLGDLDTHDQVCRKLVNDAKYDVCGEIIYYDQTLKKYETIHRLSGMLHTVCMYGRKLIFQRFDHFSVGNITRSLILVIVII